MASIVFDTTFPVRYYETDLMGIVHHSNYIRYFECARDAFLIGLGYPIEEMEKDGVYVAIVGIEIRYRHPARMGDVVTCYAECDEVPLAKMKVHQKVTLKDGEVCAEGTVTLGFLDTKTLRPVPCPEKFRRLLSERLSAQD